MYNASDIEVKFSTKHLPFEYKWLEFRLMVNKELYDEKVINLRIFKMMEQSILTRMVNIKNRYDKYFIDSH